ncbi:hypothetical protein Tco_1296144, partial [Tanacetum coccineum]
ILSGVSSYKVEEVYLLVVSPLGWGIDLREWLGCTVKPQLELTLFTSRADASCPLKGCEPQAKYYNNLKFVVGESVRTLAKAARRSDLQPWQGVYAMLQHCSGFACVCLLEKRSFAESRILPG